VEYYSTSGDGKPLPWLQDSNETFVDVEVREGIPRTEKIFRAFVTGTPGCSKNGLATELIPDIEQVQNPKKSFTLR
jgi:hypothetical protein